MNIEEIKSLINTINQSNIEKVKFKNNDVTLEIINNSGIGQINQQSTIGIETNQEETLQNHKKNMDAIETVKSPLVGVFYEASGPTENPFVVEGQRVEKGEVLCIVEAMKVMNEIVAKEDCIIKKVLVSNEEIVEYDQDLFIVE